MFQFAAVGLMTAAIYSDYPAFIKRDAAVEAYTDRGPIVELIVRCPKGAGIMSYSKIDGLFCSSKHKCFTRLQPAIANTCG